MYVESCVETISQNIELSNFIFYEIDNIYICVVLYIYTAAVLYYFNFIEYDDFRPLHYI